MDIGFIGVGRMGRVMVRNLLASGHRVRAWDMSSDALNEIRKAGAQTATGATDAFRGEAVISMLPDDDTMRTTFLDAAVLRGGAPIHVNMATASVLAPTSWRRRTRQTASFTSPRRCSAGRRWRPKRNLNILAAGDPQAIERIQPLFDAMGEKTWRLGPSCATRMSPRSPAT